MSAQDEMADDRADGSPEPLVEGVVYVVDDDPEVREYVEFMLQPLGVQICSHAEPEEFLNAYTDRGPACLVTDVFMPGMTGIDLQHELARRGAVIPIIVMSGRPNVPNVVEAVRNGALDFLEKPFEAQTLRERVRAGLILCDEWRRRADERARVQKELARLTPRQRSVLDGLVAGKASKIIADDLGVSPRTVDVHRFRLMHTLGAQSLPDLFRLVAIARGQVEQTDAPITPASSPKGAESE